MSDLTSQPQPAPDIPRERAAHAPAVQSPAHPGPDAGARAMLHIEPLEQGCGLRIGGEVDLSNVADLRLALDMLSTVGDCRLCLAELRFIDVAGTRELVRFARRAPARAVVLHSPPALLMRILSIGWPDFSPDIEGR